MDRVDRRSELREATFLILFRAVFFDAQELRFQIEDFFSDEDFFSEKERKYISDKVLKIASKLTELDDKLDEVSVGWKTKRMTKVDLTVLRLACYEILFEDAVPIATSINDAVELAKNYGTENSGSFVNGILAKVAESVK